MGPSARTRSLPAGALAGMLLLPAAAGAAGVTRGALSLDANALLVTTGTDDIQEIYGPGLEMNTGTGRITGFGGGAAYALTSRIHLGVALDVLPKEYEIAIVPSGAIQTWSLPVRRIMARGRFCAGTFPVKGIPISLMIEAGAGVLNLSGATLKMSTETGSVDATGSGIGGVVEIVSESHLTRMLSLCVGLGYQFGRVSPVTVSGRLGYVLVPEQTLRTGDGEEAGFDYSGLVVKAAARLYLMNPGGPSVGGTTKERRTVRYTEPAPQGSAGPAGADERYEEASLLYRSGKYDDAWRKSYEAIQIDPNHWQSWQMIGNCQYARGDRQGALASYRRSLEINPDNSGLKSFVDQISPR